jgi:hypothetical protein
MILAAEPVPGLILLRIRTSGPPLSLRAISARLASEGDWVYRADDTGEAEACHLASTKFCTTRRPLTPRNLFSARAALPGIRLRRGGVLQILVDESDGHASFADCGRYAFDLASPHIAAREDAGDARLE